MRAFAKPTRLIAALLLAALPLLLWAVYPVAAQPTTRAASRPASQPTTNATSAPASQPTTTTAPAPPPLTAPDPDSLKAYDRHSDDGSAIIIEWAKPAEQAPGAWYVVEMAESEEDLEGGKVSVWKAVPSGEIKMLKSSSAKYFGFAKENKSRHFVAVTPAAVVRGEGADPLPAERIGALADGKEKIVSPGDAGEAIKVLRDKRPEKKLNKDEKALREWAKRLVAHLDLAEGLTKLVQAGILTADDVDLAAAALKNRQADDALEAAQKADREWIGRLNKWAAKLSDLEELVKDGLLREAEAAHLDMIGGMPQLVQAGILAAADVDLVVAALRNRQPGGALSASQRADREWVGRLRKWGTTLLVLDALVEKDILSTEELARAREVARDRTGDDDITGEPKAAREWLERLRAQVPMLLGLADSQSRGLIEDDHVRRIVAAVRNPTPDDQLVGEERADRRWLQRITAYLEKKTQENKKAEQAELNGKTWYFRLAVTDGTDKLYVSQAGRPVVVSAAAESDYFKRFKLNNLIFAVVFSAIVLIFIQMARRNPNLFIRKIAGLEAVEEAIGRSTEMGRPTYFVHGLGAVSALGTIAAVNILARVARRAAEYDSRICVMNNDPIVTAVSQEVVQQAYTEAGRPDAFNADDVSLVASDQFSYAAAVAGRMVRERPAAVFLMGYFYAESLLLAETGAATGAIQVAGTDAYTQLPFFITTCDYTLIGEELYAASAYLSREPRMLGSLRGQDVGKAFMMVMMVVATIIITIYAAAKMDYSWIRSFLEAF